LQQTADDDGDDNNADDADHDVAAGVDQLLSFPAVEIVSRDPPADVTVAPDNANAPSVKRCDAAVAVSDATSSSVSLAATSH